MDMHPSLAILLLHLFARVLLFSLPPYGNSYYFLLSLRRCHEIWDGALSVFISYNTSVNISLKTLALTAGSTFSMSAFILTLPGVWCPFLLSM